MATIFSLLAGTGIVWALIAFAIRRHAPEPTRSASAPPPKADATPPAFDAGDLLRSDLHLTVGIQYVDGKRDRTNRVITIRSIFGKRGFVPGLAWANYVYADCYLRADLRHFKVRNIVALVTPTGAVVDDAEAWLAQTFGLREFPPPPPEHRPLSAETPELLVVDTHTKTRVTRRIRPTYAILVAGRPIAVRGPTTRFRKKPPHEQSDDWPATLNPVQYEFAEAETGEIISDPVSWAEARLLPKPQQAPPADPELAQLWRRVRLYQ